MSLSGAKVAAMQALNKITPEERAVAARKGKKTAAQKEAALQARMDAIAERARQEQISGNGYDVMYDYRLNRGWRGSKVG